jgi:hypothetical protein
LSVNGARSSEIIFTGNGCLEILITFVFFHIHFHSIASSNFNHFFNEF